MISLSRVVRSLSLNAQTLYVYRTTGKFGLGGWIAAPEEELEISGVAFPSSARELQMVPEGDRALGAITFFTVEPLYVTRGSSDPASGISDKILWGGEYYKILWSNPWLDYGYYSSIAQRIVGD